MKEAAKDMANSEEQVSYSKGRLFYLFVVLFFCYIVLFHASLFLLLFAIVYLFIRKKRNQLHA